MTKISYWGRRSISIEGILSERDSEFDTEALWYRR